MGHILESFACGRIALEPSFFKQDSRFGKDDSDNSKGGLLT